ncbi:MAG: amidophosphoribosyltransferase [Bacteroidetes bacterium GWA2_40_15]|nr:MAG: amidophosphoribosyltransferase [Bacteroidetes bacterium GWA2_40_15]HBQ83521.1 ComF family protein [Bacteroidales bacterium]
MNYLYDLWDDFLSLLFPRICYGCGNHLLRNENLICTECYVVIPRTNYHIQKENPVAQLFWGRCLIESAAAFSYYNKGSRIRNLIHNLKYKGIREIGFELGKIYGLTLKSSGFTDNIDIIIPVPLHPAKERARGFNQCKVISSGLADATGLPVNTTSFERVQASSTQTKRSRYDRWVNVEGIFRVTDPDSLGGRHILLVDDVITTGSTMESCVNELLKTEEVKVSVVAIAFAPA